MPKAKDRSAREHKGPNRCAIYTRKSHEEGLEQDFNSLDAQREACEAYILSQKHEGWACLPGLYDDGGVSGATLERPALKRLLADIKAGQVDAVVVYKVDRLTRALSDFAKIVDVFDKKDVSFVSVTQQFNTTSSMGRLTLNMLLSFAQFEREVTGERIRDKIAASKKKGMWMGGLTPLGYDSINRKLVINQTEAETVRHIYQRYAALGSVRALKDDLDRDGIVSKVRVDRFGRTTGGKPLARGALYLMLQNRIYLGEIVHKEHSYPGKHDPIIDKALWEDVQHKLTKNRVTRVTGAYAKQPSLLAGLLYDGSGHRMTPSHANKNGVRYRYYVSQGLVRQSRKHTPRGQRVPARDVEKLVEERLTQFLTNEGGLFEALQPSYKDVDEVWGLMKRAGALAQRWPLMEPAQKRAVLTTLIRRIDLQRKTIEISLSPNRLPTILSDEEDREEVDHPIGRHGPTLSLSISAQIKRTGMETRMLINGTRRKPDRSLCRVLAQAHHYQSLVLRNGGKSIGEFAAEAGVTGSYFTRILRLSFLAPIIVTSILNDRHSVDLTAKRLANEVDLPVSWERQSALLGVG